MNNPKYRLSEQSILDMEHGVVLYRIVAQRTFESTERIIKKGSIGGYVCGYHNLSQDGKCWVDDNARIFGQARILENAFIKGNSTVSDDVEVSGYAKVMGCVKLKENVLIGGEATIEDNAVIEGNVIVQDKCRVYENAIITGDVQLFGKCKIGGNCFVYGKSIIKDQCEISGDAVIGGHARLENFVSVRDKAIVKEHALLHGRILISGNAKIIGYSNVDYDVGGMNVINTSIENKQKAQPFLKQHFIETLAFERGSE